MSGSSGGRVFRRTPEADIRRWLEEAQRGTHVEEYEAEVSEALNELLSEYNRRDVELVRERLDRISLALTDRLESVVETQFGGSVHRHTYVEGLSDVDALAFLKGPEWANASPSEVLTRFENAIREGVPEEADTSRGRLAVTVRYADGLEIQILPAIRTAQGIRLADPEADEWSNVVRPDRFARRLTDLNRQLRNRLVPTIKIVKGALAKSRVGALLRGYHIESLAVRAFEDYPGPLTTKHMVEYFFDRANDLVRSPIVDSTNQSLRVDEYLGPSRSALRARIGASLQRIGRRLKYADAMADAERWLEVAGVPEE